MPRRIAFYVVPAFQLLDLSGPLTAFQIAADIVAGAYLCQVLSLHGGLVASEGGVAVDSVRAAARTRDTVVVVGGRGARLRVDRRDPQRIDRLAARARRVVSVCTGAFLLAAAGWLGGRRVTTHWRYASALQAAYPVLRVEPQRIFINDGEVWSSAGISAGIDLALALIEQDLGRAVAQAVAREMLVYHRRPGGQGQFSAMLEMEPSSDRIGKVLQFAREHLHQPLPVERLAEVARLSPRQFSRRFSAQTGQTPAKAVERLRVEAARTRVEDGAESLERIAKATGLVDTERMRQSFLRAFGQPPQALRRLARGAAGDGR